MGLLLLFLGVIEKCRKLGAFVVVIVVVIVVVHCCFFNNLIQRVEIKTL